MGRRAVPRRDPAPRERFPDLARPTPGTYPLGVALRLTTPIEVAAQWITGRPSTHTPPHLRIRVDRLVWQVCDQHSWRRIGQAWFDAQQYLTLG